MMRFQMSWLVVASCTVLLSACARPEEEDVFPDTDRSTTDDNLALANAAIQPLTPVASLPGGSVNYSGVLAASVTGDYTGSLYADLDMTVDFAAFDVTGMVGNVDLIDDATGDVVQDLRGTPALNGTADQGAIAGQVTGTLTGVGSVTGVSTASFILGGTTRTGTTPGDTIYGPVIGNTFGGFNLALSNGEFYASAD